MPTGRNDPCPCGSQKKYKRCCLFRDRAVVQASGDALARKRIAELGGGWARVRRNGQEDVRLKTAPLEEYQREAKRFERSAEERGWSRRDLAERTGHPLTLIDLALDVRHGVPLPINVLNSIAEVLGTTLLARDSMTLSVAMDEIATCLGERLTPELSSAVRNARTPADFTALRLRLGRRVKEPRSGPPTLVDLVQFLEEALETPMAGLPWMEANLPHLVACASEPGFTIGGGEKPS